MTNDKALPASRAGRQFTGYVLAGGISSRFGRDKALTEIGGAPMLARTLGVLSPCVSGNAVVIGLKEKYRTFGECVEDHWPGEGPLGGIVTALEHSRQTAPEYAWNVILSCDMPFLTTDFLGFLVERAAKSDALVVMPHSEQGPEPLCGCWRTDAASTLRQAFERGVRKVTDGIALLRTEVLDAKDWKRFDTAGRLFWNMNTVQDCEEAKRMLQEAGEGAARGL